MSAIELLRAIRADVLPNAIGNCECSNCKRDRKWLHQIDLILDYETGQTKILRVRQSGGASEATRADLLALQCDGNCAERHQKASGDGGRIDRGTQANEGDKLGALLASVYRSFADCRGVHSGS